MERYIGMPNQLVVATQLSCAFSTEVDPCAMVVHALSSTFPPSPQLCAQNQAILNWPPQLHLTFYWRDLRKESQNLTIRCFVCVTFNQILLIQHNIDHMKKRCYMLLPLVYHAINSWSAAVLDFIHWSPYSNGRQEREVCAIICMLAMLLCYLYGW